MTVIEILPQTAHLDGTGQQIALSAPEIAAGTVSAASAAGASWATAAIPIIGPVVAGVTLGLGLLFSRKRPKQKVAATHIVDDLEPHLKANLKGYFEGPRTETAQRQALANFDAAWSYLTSRQGCGNPELGPPGQWCISDRARGGRWDWFRLYRDPIADDPEVRPDPTPAQQLEAEARTAVAQIGLPLTAAAGLALIGLGVALS